MSNLRGTKRLQSSSTTPTQISTHHVRCTTKHLGKEVLKADGFEAPRSTILGGTHYNQKSQARLLSLLASCSKTPQKSSRCMTLPRHAHIPYSTHINHIVHIEEQQHGFKSAGGWPVNSMMYLRSAKLQGPQLTCDFFHQNWSPSNSRSSAHVGVSRSSELKKNFCDP